jgi:hypothetical protein
MTKWINLFRTGTHTDSAGRQRTWSENDLDRIVENFNQRTEDPPVVFGHPKDSDPAQGWIKEVRNNGGTLQAQFARVSDEARQAVDNGAYQYGSLSLTPDLKIRHFGLLGAVPPAVKGLGRVEFKDEGGLTVDINFNEPDGPANPPDDPAPEDDMTKELEARVKELEAQAEADRKGREKAEADLKTKESEFAEEAAKQRKAALTARVDKLVEDGRLLPADKDKTLAFCEALDGLGPDAPKEMSFSEGEGKKPLVEHFLSFMAERGEHGLFTEFAAPAGGQQDAPEFDGNALARKF